MVLVQRKTDYNIADSLSEREAPEGYPERLRALRARLGLTQVRLAELMGVSFASVNRWENGQSRPSALAWQRLVRGERFGIEGFDPDWNPGEATASQLPIPGLAKVQKPQMDFSSDPNRVWAVAEGERLSFGHLFNPAFATEVSMIDPVPHQRIAVYQHMLPQSRLRFLLADDAGAGKTIMSGLYAREMLSRRLLSRILVLPPAGLLGNWEKEMRTLFNLPFRIVLGQEGRLRNPFAGADSNLVIVSIDTLAGERMFGRLQEDSVEPYDLVIFDEAHKLAADREPDFRIRRTDRYRLAEALAGIRSEDERWHLDWVPQHLLLLTATPHMGKDLPYYFLWRLLEPEVLPTVDAFNAYPAEERRRHFLRRTKEEMVRFDGSPLFPTRISDTVSYDLTQGEESEQALYDQTTDYIKSFYNRARILNRSAARFAMMIFQRRLASSTYALMRSFERRLAKIEGLISDVRSGKLSPEQLAHQQRRLDRLRDVFESMTGDEESAGEGSEENERAEDEALGGVVASSLAELEAERRKLDDLLELAKRVSDKGEESKFEKLREILNRPDSRDEKLIVFTEYRHTLDFLVRRLEGLGFTGQVAQIHGGMDYKKREDQVDLFRRPLSDGGATFLVATDAAGEGINLQFCWRTVNYDIPWNPARLEQRMGRTHRYLQEHDPVVILNLVAGKTREGRVLATLLTKLEKIRREMGSDKVFDVIGRLFEGISLKDYMEEAFTEEGADQVVKEIEGKLTKEQIEALKERERRLYGDGGDVKVQLPDMKVDLEREELRRLLPGYVRRFIERAAPLIDIGVEGDLESHFGLKPLKPQAMDPLWPALERYLPDRGDRLTVYRPQSSDNAVFLHPGEPLFDRFRSYVVSQFSSDALRGSVFVDPTANSPYVFHLALVTIHREADPTFEGLMEEEMIECRLIGMRQEEDGTVQLCPIEQLLLLKGTPMGSPASYATFASTVPRALGLVETYVKEQVASPLAEEWRRRLRESLPTKETFLINGFDYQESELAAARAQLTDKVRAGDSRAKTELAKVKERQRRVAERRARTVSRLRREPDLIAPDEVEFISHVLVVPSSDPEDKSRHDREIEAVAIRVVRAHEEAQGATVRDVSTPALARTAGLDDNPGFDLLSRRTDGEERPIEVKGRVGLGDVELTENEWARACNLRTRYWLYVVYDCGTPNPRLFRVRDPFEKLLVRPRGSVIIDEKEILNAAEA